MTGRLAALAILAACFLADAESVDARVPRFCRRNCGAAISSCVQVGGRRVQCRRQVVHRCKTDRSVCTGPATTTTTSFFPTTTTLFSGTGTVEIEASNVRTLYEIGYAVPAPAMQFVAIEVTIRNHSTYGVSPTGVALRAEGLDYLGYGYPVFVPGACDPYTTVTPGGELTCGLVYQVREGTASGRLAAFSYLYGTGPVLSEEFTIPTGTRPYATLTIDDVLATPSLPYCTPRPGFTILVFALSLTSHGASGLTIDLYDLAVEANNARYTSRCGYLAPDPCDGAIGVPVDGSVSCSAAFEVPEETSEGTLAYGDGRYTATSPFVLD